MSREKIDNELQKAEKEIKWALYSSIPLAIPAILAPILAYYNVGLPLTETPDLWFQRSGSLSVLFAVWMEYNLSKANEHINLSGIVIGDQVALSKKYSLVYKITKYVGVLLAISGTIIWGYGDLLI